jgi:hypothetical protein
MCVHSLEKNSLYVHGINLKTTPIVKTWKPYITVETGYNNIGLYDTSPTTSDVMLYQLVPHC